MTVDAPAFKRNNTALPKKGSAFQTIMKHRYIYLMLVPVLLYYFFFHYLSMGGALIAFKDYSIGKSLLENIFETPWVGLKHFRSFITNPNFLRVLRNTLLLNGYNLLFGFPMPIVLALLLNEVRSRHFKKTVQTVSYIPHFISTVVICGLIVDFTSLNGIVNTIVRVFGGEQTMFLVEAQFFRPVYIISGIWQEIGWGSIIYLAALAGIDAELYEAAVIDGAGRFRQLLSITLPALLPTIAILLIMRIGQMMNIGVEKILLLYRPTTYETADVISSYVYRRGLIERQYSFSAAVGIFNSVINFVLLWFANTFSKRMTETSLW